jgi:hypothetical protein
MRFYDHYVYQGYQRNLFWGWGLSRLAQSVLSPYGTGSILSMDNLIAIFKDFCLCQIYFYLESSA